MLCHIAILVLLFGGCSSLRYQRTMPGQEGAWAQFGGEPGRRQATERSIALPLQKAWEADASAGFGAFSAIAIDSMVVTGTLQGDVFAYHVATGKKIGSYDFGSAVAGAPAIQDSLLVVPIASGDEGVIAYNLHTGRILWRGMTGPVESSPLILGGTVIVTALGGSVECLDALSGVRLWRFRLPDRGRSSFIRSSPSAADSVIVFGADDGYLYGLRRESGSLLWSMQTGGCITASPVIDGGMVFAGSEDGMIYAVAAATGNLVWKTDAGAPVISSAAVGTDRVFVGATSGRLVSLDRATGSPQWSFHTKSVVTAAPLLAGGTLFIGSLDRTLYALDARNGSCIWSAETESRIRTTPILVAGRLIVQLEDRVLVAFTSQSPRQ